MLEGVASEHVQQQRAPMSRLQMRGYSSRSGRWFEGRETEREREKEGLRQVADAVAPRARPHRSDHILAYWTAGHHASHRAADGGAGRASNTVAAVRRPDDDHDDDTHMIHSGYTS